MNSSAAIQLFRVVCSLETLCFSTIRQHECLITHVGTVADFCLHFKSGERGIRSGGFSACRKLLMVWMLWNCPKQTSSLYWVNNNNSNHISCVELLPRGTSSPKLVEVTKSSSCWHCSSTWTMYKHIDAFCALIICCCIAEDRLCFSLSLCIYEEKVLCCFDASALQSGNKQLYFIECFELRCPYCNRQALDFFFCCCFRFAVAECCERWMSESFLWNVSQLLTNHHDGKWSNVRRPAGP